MKLRLAHSPDSDDAFMFYALAQNRIPTGDYQFEHILKDIETLNQEATQERYDISAISLHAFPELAEHYQLLSCGASVGDNYGPRVVSQKPLSRDEFKQEFTKLDQKKTIAIPGEKTTAFLTLKMMLEKPFAFKPMPFDQILDAVKSGQVDAGLIIHEGQLNYADHGLSLVVDLGQWWKEETNLPLPLGANVIRRSLGRDHIHKISHILKESIEIWRWRQSIWMKPWIIAYNLPVAWIPIRSANLCRCMSIKERLILMLNVSKLWNCFLNKPHNWDFLKASPGPYPFEA